MISAQPSATQSGHCKRRSSSLKTASLQANPASAVAANRVKLCPKLVWASRKLKNRCPAKLTKNAIKKPQAFASSGPDAFRYAGVTMCSVFLLGLIVLPFLPETKDEPLPE